MVQLLFVTLTVPEDCDNLAAVNILCVSLRQNLPCAAFVIVQTQGHRMREDKPTRQEEQGEGGSYTAGLGFTSCSIL
jgi:hypothetical protein